MAATKIIFTNKPFFYILVGVLTTLLLWNIFIGISTGNFWAIIPVLFQSALLILILTSSEYARIIIIAYAVIFLIGANILGLLADLLDMGNTLLDNTVFKLAGTNDIIYSLVQLGIGIVIFDFTKRTVKKEYAVNNELEQLQP